MKTAIFFHVIIQEMRKEKILFYINYHSAYINIYIIKFLLRRDIGMKMKSKTFIHIVCNVMIFVLLSSILLFTTYDGVAEVFGVVDENAPIYSGNKESNKVSLMINVYWGTEYIEEILDILDKYNWKTTFFIGGMWAVKNSDILEEMVSRGHEIGSHGYYHKDMGKMSYDKCVEEMENTNTLLTSLTGKEVILFAPPSGSFSKDTVQASADCNMKMIMWTKDTIDWRDKSHKIIYNRAVKDISGGDLILMHPTEMTVSALPDILEHYKANGLVVDTVTNTIK